MGRDIKYVEADSLPVIFRAKAMLFKKYDRNSVEWKRFVAWIVGTVVMPFVAFPFIKQTSPDLQFDIPVILILAFFWGICSAVLRIFVNKNIH